ncbi:hypothetical protein [Amphritea balenae]|uniref:Uncharacterized protein n=1 Tax=Amphritea balenae TaxID=452629 RepID=A0A3P1SQV6_9GAMM|nr:hypothetical protein [Amphritea balenae]RRC99556.1 hypothetical protein EHS89_08605 [Amphritea balenae]GGK78005.1 hypothetical protein GCM10007941_30120 [Amphritea balenae]
MDIWQTRNESLKFLETELSSQKIILEQCFRLMDHCIEIFEDKSETSPPHNVCAIALVKGRNYALGSYGMMLDGLGQEAGALMRPMVEYLELLKYFRLFPEDVDLAFSGKLPKAGERAKKINGIHKEIRDHFNSHSSHSSFSEHSVKHLFEADGFKLRKVQPLSKGTLFRNLGSLFTQLYILLRESVLCVNWLEGGITEDLADFVDTLHAKGIEAFELDGLLK